VARRSWSCSNMANEVLARDAAEAEFSRFLTLNRLKVRSLEQESRAQFEELRGRFVECLQDGTLTVDEKGRPTYTPIDDIGTPITFSRPKGASIMVMDREKGEQRRARAMLAELTGQDASRFAKMDLADVRVLESIEMLFLVLS
jgi:hypothetical protein